MSLGSSGLLFPLLSLTFIIRVAAKDYASSEVLDPQWDADGRAEAATTADREGGDALITASQRDDGYRNAVDNRGKLWPRGVVPFAVSQGILKSPNHTAQIRAAIDDFHKFTCVKWVRVRYKKDLARFPWGYVKFIMDKGCYSLVGYNWLVARQGQPISIGRGCERAKGTVIHEMMHALGFQHEQNRADRDDHVKILYENINKTYFMQFGKMASHADLGNPYDFKSVMHYASYYFVKINGSAEPLRNMEVIDKDMTPAERENATQNLGQRMGFTNIDVLEINRLYKCTDFLTNMSSTTAAPRPPTTSTKIPTTSTLRTTTTTRITTTTTRPPTTTKALTTTTLKPAARRRPDLTPIGRGSSESLELSSAEVPPPPPSSRERTESETGSSGCSDSVPMVERRVGWGPRVSRPDATFCERLGRGEACGDPWIGFRRCRATCGNCASEAKLWLLQEECEDANSRRVCQHYKYGCGDTDAVDRGNIDWIRFRSRCRRTCGFCTL